MTDVLFFDLFDSTSKMVYFLLGLVAGAWLTYRFGRKPREAVSLQPVGILAGITAIVFVLVQNLNLTAEMRQCTTEFQKALNVRSKSTENFMGLTTDWLEKFATPPPDIDKLPITDPVRIAWFRGTFATYRVNVDGALTNLQQHPYPPPRCGKP